LLSNTPLREVLDASPINDKRIFLVENCPKKPALPKNLPDVFHRARDIIFSDKSEHNIKMYNVFTWYLHYIDELYNVIEQFTDTTKLDEKQLKIIRSKYKNLKKNTPWILKISFTFLKTKLILLYFKMPIFLPIRSKNSIEEYKKTNQVLIDGNSFKYGDSFCTKMYT
jgi:NTE family protein